MLLGKPRSSFPFILVPKSGQNNGAQRKSKSSGSSTLNYNTNCNYFQNFVMFIEIAHPFNNYHSFYDLGLSL